MSRDNITKTKAAFMSVKSLVKGAFALCLCVCLLLGIYPQKEAYASDDVSSAISEIYSAVTAEDSDPNLDSTWHVLAVSRSAKGADAAYCLKYYNNSMQKLADGGWSYDTTIYSMYSKLIIGLTACGYDASNSSGRNMLAYLSDFSNVKKQGINGVAYALIALRAAPSYSIPSDSSAQQQNSEEVMVNYILNAQISADSGGGWAMWGSVPDVDITCIVLTALAPLYDSDENVKAAADKALVWLSAAQKDDGGYMALSSGSPSENAESVSQVVTALSALGIDADTDERFVKNSNSALDALMSYYMGSGKFMHTKGGSANALATAQGFYALVAYQRYIDGENALYDMSDITLKSGDEIVAKTPEADEDDASDNETNDSALDENIAPAADKADTSDKKTQATDKSADSQSSSKSDKDKDSGNDTDDGEPSGKEPTEEEVSADAASADAISADAGAMISGSAVLTETSDESSDTTLEAPPEKKKTKKSKKEPLYVVVVYWTAALSVVAASVILAVEWYKRNKKGHDRGDKKIQ